MHWLTMTHTQRHHRHYDNVGSGHLYQARFKAFPIESDEHLYHVIRYVERNPLRANLVAKAEDWQWTSLCNQRKADGLPLTPWPLPRPEDWIDIVNRPQNEAEEFAIRHSIKRGTPYGSENWIKQTANQLQLQHTLRSVGRPKKRTIRN
jgi:putative transposase